MKCSIVKKNMVDIVEGTLDETVQEQVNKHISLCNTCREKVNLFRKTIELTRSAPHVPTDRVFWPNFLVTVKNRIEQKSRHQRVLIRKLSLAMVFGAFLIALVLWYGQRGSEIPIPGNMTDFTSTVLDAEDIVALEEELFADSEDLISIVQAMEFDPSGLVDDLILEEGVEYLSLDDLLEGITEEELQNLWKLQIINM